MTHYRLTLTKGRGPKMKMIAERHSYSKTPPSGWWRSVHRLGSSIHVVECLWPDPKCSALSNPGGEAEWMIQAAAAKAARSQTRLKSPHTPTTGPEDSEPTV